MTFDMVFNYQLSFVAWNREKGVRDRDYNFCKSTDVKRK